MKKHLYAKLTDNIDIFGDVLGILPPGDTDLTTENRRCFDSLEKLKAKCGPDDILAIPDISTLGINADAILSQLGWFIQEKRLLVICSYEGTYQYGISHEINGAVLQTISQSLSNTLRLPQGKNNCGRHRIAFPDGWETLYEKWQRKEISSKEFMRLSGLKKTVLYNLITEYRMILEKQEYYTEKYNAS